VHDAVMAKGVVLMAEKKASGKRPVNKASHKTNDYSDANAQAESSLPSAVKGVIAVMLTFLLVVVITMLFANSLFSSDVSATSKKTGRITSTEYVEVSTAATTTTTTTTTTRSTDDPYQTTTTTSELGEATVMTIISAVYLHPEPTSQSENLTVIPVGATVKVYKNEGGWLYLDYNGQMGYAYHTFFSN